MKEKIKNIWSRIESWSFAIFALILLIIISLCYLIFFATKFPIDQDSLCWFFSTVAQSFLALIAFLGMLVIFKLQNLHTILNALLESSKKIVEYFKGADIRYSTQKELIKICAIG